MTANWNELLADALPTGGAQTPVHLPVITQTKDTRLTAPTTREELRQWCKLWLDVALPMKAVCSHHDTTDRNFDSVGSCRGGGGTGVSVERIDDIFGCRLVLAVGVVGEAFAGRILGHRNERMLRPRVAAVGVAAGWGFAACHGSPVLSF
jgi:hypothetical protein